MPSTLARRRRPRIRQPITYGGTLFVELNRMVRASSRVAGSDSDLLTNLAQGGRYNTTWFLRLIDLSAKCHTPEGRYALANLVRRLIDARCAAEALPLVDAIAEETAAQGPEDTLPMLALVRQCPATASAALEAIDRYEHTLTRLRQSLAVVATGGFR